MQLEISAKGTDDAGRKIDLLAGRARDPRLAFSRITDQLIKAEVRRFNSSNLRDIKTSTIQRKNRDKDPKVRANSYKTLKGTGNLFDYLTHRGGNAQPFRFTREEVGFGIPPGRHALFYARIQAHSGRNPVVPSRTIRRVSKPIIRDFLLGKEI